MIRKFFSATLVSFSLLFFVNAYASIEETHVTLTNNTNTPLTIHTNLVTGDADFTKGYDWDALAVTLEPYESRQVLWFARNQDVKENMDYQYDLVAARTNSVTDNFVLRFNVKGSHFFGSVMTNAMQLPDASMQTILQEKGLEHYPAHFWGGNYVVHARRFKPTTNLFTNVHLVIDQKDESVAPPSNDSTLHVLTYNTQLQPFYGRVVNDLNQPGEREKNIVPAISQYDAVIFEELFDHDLRDQLIKDMSVQYPYHTRVVGDDSEKPWTGGVMLFSKWPIEKENQIVYQATTGADSYAAKGAVYALLNKHGHYYHVFGTHLEAGKSTEDVRMRRKQLAELENFIDRMNIRTDEPVLIGGDMNIDEFSLEASTLYHSLNALKVDSIGYKYSSDALVNLMDVDSDRERIDFVLYDTRHLVPKTAVNKVIILRALYDEKMWPKFELSDHFPVEGYFEF